MKKAQLKAEYKGVGVKLSLFIYIDDKVNVVYSPALDMYGYGYDENEARESFIVTLNEYITYTTHKKTLHADLTKYGWHLHKRAHKIDTPDIAQLIAKNKDFAKLLEAKAFRKYDMNINIPAYA